MKKYLSKFLLLVFVLLLAACGTATTEDNGNGNVSGDSTGQVVEGEDKGEEKSIGEDDHDYDGVKEEEIIREEVVFIGLADPHTIEVEKDGEPFALQILDPRVKDVDFENIEPNTPVIIEYYVNKVDEKIEQNILTSFEIKG